MPHPKSSEEQLGLFQLSILALSVVVLALVAADTFFTLPTEVSRFIQGVDFVICLVFFADFVVRFKRPSVNSISCASDGSTFWRVYPRWIFSGSDG